MQVRALHDAAGEIDGIRFEALPPERAMAYFRRLGVQVTSDYRELWSVSQRRAFTVAKLTQLDLLEKVRDLIDRAIADGISLAEFTDSVEDDLAAAGWGGELSSSRLENIYRTNLASSYSAGEWEQIAESAAARAERGKRTLLTYHAVGDERTREEHEALSGTTLPIDDPFWDECYPPIDFSCRCWVTEETDASLERDGLTVSDRPATEYVTYRNPHTEEEIRVPQGVEPGFGQRNWDTAVRDELGRRLAATSPDLRRAIRSDLPAAGVQPKGKAA
jgi:SPP1 gp7 family putative phage head morphogenesis protein